MIGGAAPAVGEGNPAPIHHGNPIHHLAEPEGIGLFFLLPHFFFVSIGVLFLLLGRIPFLLNLFK